MPQTPTVNILTWHNGSGLERDASCLEAVLTEAGFRVTQTAIHPKRTHHWPKFNKTFNRTFSKITFTKMLRGLGVLGGLADRLIYIGCNYNHRVRRRWRNRRSPAPIYDINLFLECVDTTYFSQAKKNCLIPNQEWCSPWTRLALKSFDKVLCKTHHARSVFQAIGVDAHHISFTSDGRFHAAIAPDYNACLHLAGSTSFKGTQAVVNVWRRHPEWPLLRVVRRLPLPDSETLPPNIADLHGRMSDDELIELQNRCGIRIQPSEAEGFGHVLVEGMSCGAVTIATDAPPMNEIIRPDRGILVAFRDSRPQSLGHRYFVDELQLERQLEALFQTPLSQRRELGDRARAWYLENDAWFRREIVAVLRELQS